MIRRFLACLTLFLLLAARASAQSPNEQGFVREIEEPSSLWEPHGYLKTNAVGWGMLISNIAFEIDLSPKWSLAVPIYYSALNYFRSTVKFRTAAVQPEIRYWLRSDTYVGAHFSIAHYNYALGGDLRRQDHDGSTPAWGGGLSGGFRKRLGHSDRWFLECTAGVGVYKLHYDKFINQTGGAEVGSTKKTFFCVDNVAVTFSYRFNLRRKDKE